MPPLVPPPAPLVPPLPAVALAVCVAGAGALANCALLAALLRRSANGLFSILIQLAITDILLLGGILPELWLYNSRSWNFGPHACAAYKGIEVFTSTASVYLVATLALHSLAMINIEEKELLRRNKRNRDIEDEELRSSRHSLVANSDSSTPPRSMNVEYRVSHLRVAVTRPSVFVWVLAASVSIPQFAMSTVHIHNEQPSCSLIKSSHTVYMQIMLAVFILVLPVLIFCVIVALAFAKLNSVHRLPEIYNGDNKAAVRLSLNLIFVYFLCCAPRSVFSVYRLYWFESSVSTGEALVQESVLYSALCFLFSSVYLVATCIRPILCIVLIPRLKRIFTVGSKSVNIDTV